MKHSVAGLGLKAFGGAAAGTFTPLIVKQLSRQSK
jgi:hypothetical protein